MQDWHANLSPSIKYTTPYNNAQIIVKSWVITAGTPTALCSPEFQLVWVENNIPVQWRDFRNTVFCIYYLLFGCSSWNNIHNWIFLAVFFFFFFFATLTEVSQGRELYYLRETVDVCVCGELEEKMTIPDRMHMDQHCILLWQKKNAPSW